MTTTLVKNANTKPHKNIGGTSKLENIADKIEKLMKSDKKLDEETKYVETRYNNFKEDTNGDVFVGSETQKRLNKIPKALKFRIIEI